MYGNIGNIIVIESLDSDEWHTGKDIYDDVIKRYIDYSDNNYNINHKYHDIRNADEFKNLLIQYEIELMPDNGVLFHLEVHGDENKSGLVFADGSFLGWKDILDLLRPINIKLKNKLYLSLAVCFGRYLAFQTLDIKKKSPICAFISTRKPILNSAIVEAFSIFFEKLIQTGNIVNAYKELEKINQRLIFKDVKSTIEETFRYNIEAYINNPQFRNEQRKNLLPGFEKVYMDLYKNTMLTMFNFE